MATKAVKERGICIRLACQAFRISESCYRYERKLDAENEEVATWLIKLTDNNRNWGFGLCYLYLRNLKGFKWNHKRVYRVYKELVTCPLEAYHLNCPPPLALPNAWSTD